MLVTYLNNPSEETIFGSNRIKKQHETIKLQNEEVKMNSTDQNRISEKLLRKKALCIIQL